MNVIQGLKRKIDILPDLTEKKYVTSAISQWVRWYNKLPYFSFQNSPQKVNHI